MSFVLIGLACYWWPVRREWPAAVPIAWGLAAVELVNGVGHPAWSVLRRGYTPGLVTALVLLPLAVLLARRLMALAARVTVRSLAQTTLPFFLEAQWASSASTGS